MTPEQIEKIRAQADAYAAQELPFVHPLSMRFAQIRDTEFARLVAADTWERAAKIATPKGPRPCACDWCSCGNATDMASCWAWDERVVVANDLRAEAKEPRP